MRTFSELFVGRDDCYGSYTTPSGSSPKGEKLGGRGRTTREPPTQEIYDAHIAGEKSLGIVPIRTDGTVMWFAIDVDTYNDDDLHKDLLKKVYKHNLPLVMTKSKSGGAHLWCFFTAPCTAKEARDTAKDYLKKLGLPKSTEIFPKQDKVSEKDVGSWINLPYFGDKRICLNYNPVDDIVDELNLSEFLGVSNDSAVDPLDLHHDATQPEAIAAKSNESEAPPCIDRMEEEGLQAGGRDDGLFHVATYLKKAYPDDWTELLGDWNAQHVHPPMKFGDIMRIANSNESQDYSYKCKVAPMCDLCDKATCLTRKFGVGNGLTGEEMPFSVDSIRKITSEVPVYWVCIDGSPEIKMESDDLLLYTRFKRVVFSKLDKVLPTMKQITWEKALEVFMESALKRQEAPKISGEAGIIVHILFDWLSMQCQNTRFEDAKKGLPYYDNGKAYFRGSDFLPRVRKSYPQAKLQDIWSHLSEQGATEDDSSEEDGYKLWVFPCPNLEVRKMGSGF